MATGFKSGATDLDDLFMAYQSGTKAPATGFKVGAQDLADRFQPYTTGTKVAVTGFKDGATDLSDLFQNISEPLVTVTLSGENVTHLNPGGPVSAGIRVNTDGTIDKCVGGVYTQIDSATDWIIPNGSASSLYEVRVTSVTGDPFDVSPGANGTWFAMSVNREWRLEENGATVTNDFTLEIRYNGGATIDSAIYSLNAIGA